MHPGVLTTQEFGPSRPHRLARHYRLDRGGAFLALFHHDVTIGRQVDQLLFRTRRPLDDQALHPGLLAKAEVDDIRHLRPEAVEWKLLAHQLLAADRCREASADPKPIALRPTERYLQEVP